MDIRSIIIIVHSSIFMPKYYTLFQAVEIELIERSTAITKQFMDAAPSGTVEVREVCGVCEYGLCCDECPLSSREMLIFFTPP